MSQEKKRGWIYTVATAHLDTVWNWSLQTTIRYHIPKTLSRNFALMDRFPQYKFNFEGAYRYQLMEEYYPEQFERLRRYAKQGQWIPAGAALENGDCNIPSPEALLRNFLYGNRYFFEKLGRRSKDVFLPDCFGFGYALPTLARHANLLGFSTQKLSYGPACPVPFDVGRWFGVDGQFIYACLKMGQYETSLRRVRTNPWLLDKLRENKKRFGLPATAAYHGAGGDQGGAPRESSVATVCREAGENGTQELQVISAASDQLFRDLDRVLTLPQKKRLPRWNGELLLRHHAPGAYTSRTMSKRLNRRCEVLADTAERAASAALWLGEAYPYEALTKAYERVIVHQFHDDVTGTAVMEEYQRSWNDYFLSLNEFQSAYEGSMSALGACMDTSWVKGIPILVNNPLETPRNGIVEVFLPGVDASCLAARDARGGIVPVQILQRKAGGMAIALRVSVPAMGIAVFDVLTAEGESECVKKTALRVTEHSLENRNLCVSLNQNGDITSIFDRREARELLSGPIRLQLIRHTGSRRYPAWEMRYEEISAFPRSFATGAQVDIVERGPVRAALRVTRTAEGSRFVQTLSIEEEGDVLRVENEVEWYTKETLLKVCFPLNVKNNTAVYDLGIGVIARPLSSPELYEAPAQRFASLTENDASHGVAVFSDSRVGWDHPDAHTLRLTAVATPKYPFRPESRQDLMDFGLNRFSFGIYPHKGDALRTVPGKAQAFLQPMTAFLADHHPGILGSSFSFGSLSTQDVRILALKRSEEEPDALVVRVCECRGISHEAVRLRLGRGILEARELYASEEPLGPALVERGELVFALPPFAPKTFFVRLAEAPARMPVTKPELLALPYDRTVVTFHDDFGAGRLRLPWESLAGELLPERIVCGGIPFAFGKSIARENNALACAGQELPLPVGYDTLSLLMTSVEGDREAVLLLDGARVPIFVPDCSEAIGAWDMIGLGEAGYVKECTVAYAATHTHGRFGDKVAKRLYLFRVDVAVPASGALLRLPEDSGLLLMGATLTCERHFLHAGAPLYDQLQKRRVTQKFKDSGLLRRVKGKLLHV